MGFNDDVLHMRCPPVLLVGGILLKRCRLNFIDIIICLSVTTGTAKVEFSSRYHLVNFIDSTSSKFSAILSPTVLMTLLYPTISNDTIIYLGDLSLN